MYMYVCGSYWQNKYLFLIQLIRNLLEDLPRMFAENKSVHSALGAALQAATKLLVSKTKLHTQHIYTHM